MKSSFQYILLVCLAFWASGCATDSDHTDFSRIPDGALREHLLGRWFVQQYVSKLESDPLIYEEAEFRADGTWVHTRVFRHPDYHPPKVDRLSETETWSLADGGIVRHFAADEGHHAWTATSPILSLTRDKLVFTDPTGAQITYRRKLKQILIPHVP